MMNKKTVSILFLLVLLIVGFIFWQQARPQFPSEAPSYLANESSDTNVTESAVTVLAENLMIPWEIVFLPDGELLVTERPGRVLLLKSGTVIDVEGIKHVGEGGLLGAVLHPDFVENNMIYLYQTTETESGITNRIVRYKLIDDTLSFDRAILENIPGAWYHDGGRVAFGPDGMLYATVGDATNNDLAQDLDSLAGSILRMTPEGEIPEDNPIAGSYIYAYGSRNAQGLAWDDEGRLWSSEHGRSVGASGYDEINLILPGANYGWPDSQGDDVAAGTEAPKRHSTADITWAPGGLAYLNRSLFMTGLRGETLYEAVVEGDTIVEWKEHLSGEYGRLRTVQVGPDGLLYLLTSNRDGRNDDPAENDDRLIRLDPSKL